MVRSVVVVLLLACGLRAQENQLDELARRAEAALDSRPAEAAALYRQVLASRPNWVQGWFYLGAAFYGMDRYVEAASAFRRTVELAPGHGTAWAFLGLSEAELDDPEQALADIRKGQQLGVEGSAEFEAAVRVRAARLLIQTSQFDEAPAQLQPLSKRNDNSPAAVETMGLCALAIPAKLSALTPAQRAVVQLAGKAAWATVSQRPAEAAAAYKELIEKYPGQPGVRYAYGLYMMETDLEAALAEFQKEVKANPTHWPAMVVLASLHVKRGEAEPAVQILRETLKVAPLRYRWLCRTELGRAHLTGDDLEAATKELQTAVRLMPNSAPVRFLLAEAYRRSGKREEAQKELAEFRRLKALTDPLGVPGLRPFADAGR